MCPPHSPPTIPPQATGQTEAKTEAKLYGKTLDELLSPRQPEPEPEPEQAPAPLSLEPEPEPEPKPARRRAPLQTPHKHAEGRSPHRSPRPAMACCSSPRSQPRTGGAAASRRPKEALDSPRSRVTTERIEAPDSQALLAGFEAADTAGLGSLDAAQVLALARELLPGCAEHRAALHCAHTAADIASDGRIERADFETLIAHVVFFNNLWHAFEATDTDGERQIDCAEFVLGCSTLSQPVAQAEAEAAYDQLQQEAKKYQGDVTFDVFCVWCVVRRVWCLHCAV